MLQLGSASPTSASNHDTLRPPPSRPGQRPAHRHGTPKQRAQRELRHLDRGRIAPRGRRPGRHGPTSGSTWPSRAPPSAPPWTSPNPWTFWAATPTPTPAASTPAFMPGWWTPTWRTPWTSSRTSSCRPSRPRKIFRAKRTWCSKRSPWWRTTRKTASWRPSGPPCGPIPPWGHSILGVPGNVRGFKLPGLENWRASHYRPGRMLISAAGSLEHDVLLGMIERRFGGLEPAPPGPVPCRGAYRPPQALQGARHRAEPRDPVLSRHGRQRRATFRHEHAKRRAGGQHVLAALPGSARKARPGLQRLLLRQLAHGPGRASGLRRRGAGPHRRTAGLPARGTGQAR